MPIPLGILAVAGAGGATGFDLLSTTILSSTASSVEFTGLGSYSDYKHLQVRYTARHTTNAGATFMLLRMNSDSTGSYSRHRLSGTGSQVLSQNATNTTSTEYAFWTAGAGNVANSFAAGMIDILDFSNTNKNTTFRGWSGVQSNTGNTDTNITIASAVWRNTNAVTSITFSIEDAYNFASGSRFSLYGMKG